MDRKKRVLPLFAILLTLALSTVTLIAENYATGIISIDLPANYHIAYSEHKKISSPIPGAKATMESSALFLSNEGKKIFLFYWSGDSSRNLGPMKAIKHREIKVAGKTCRLVETSMFMGLKQKVNAFFCKLNDKNTLMIYTPNLMSKNFQEFLQRISLEN